MFIYWRLAVVFDSPLDAGSPTQVTHCPVKINLQISLGQTNTVPHRHPDTNHLYCLDLISGAPSSSPHPD